MKRAISLQKKYEAIETFLRRGKENEDKVRKMHHLVDNKEDALKIGEYKLFHRPPLTDSEGNPIESSADAIEMTHLK